MKKHTLSLLLVGAFLFAQPADAQVRFGVKAGVNASDIKFESGSNMGALLGYQGGLMVDVGLSPKLSIQPALLFVTKGFGTELEFRDVSGIIEETGRSTFRTNYIELPVLALYKVNIGKSCHVFGGLGPYVAAGINGKFDFGGKATSYDIVFQPKNGPKEGAYDRMDYGLSTAAGLEMGRISLAVNYSYGLTGIYPQAYASEPKAFYNRSLGLTAGYWFGKTH